jgi:hypothetical protein
MSQLRKNSLISFMCAAAFCVLGCKTKPEATPNTTNVIVPMAGSTPTVMIPTAPGSAVTTEEWEDCAEAAKAHALWLSQRIATDAGKSLSNKQAVEIQRLCAYGKWSKGTVACFDNTTSGAELDKCAEKLSVEQKQAVSDMFTEILSTIKNAAVGSGSSS